MKSPIILATLFAGSLAAVPLPLPGICIPDQRPNCALVKTAISNGLAVARPLLPKCTHMEDAIDAAKAAFNNKIKCPHEPKAPPAPEPKAPPAPEPEAPPAGEQCDCKAVNAAIEKGKSVLVLAIGCYPGFCEGVEEAERVFRKRVGCEKEAGVMARDIEVACRAA
ncbi:hypothetical protein MY3296_007225 [Beauveria thailandica]